MHTPRKIALRIIAFALLAAVSDVTIFHRSAAADFLRADVGALVSHRFVEPAAAVLMGLALLSLLVGLRWLGHNLTSFARYLWGAPEHAFDAEHQVAAEKDLRANRIQVITTIVQALGGIAVLIGIYFAWANLRTTQEAQKDTQNTQEKTLNIANEGQITERFTKAIDQLGATDNQGQPRLELRLGGIYALEGIARESEEEHWPIMEVLTTYIRVHAPVQKTPVDALGPDIQAILTVIGRRELRYEQGKNEILDLSNTNLAKADLSNAHLSNAHLSGANLNHANLPYADLGGANLRYADLGGAHLRNADLGGVHLNVANLRNADLGGANLRNADLGDAHLSHADLDGAHLSGADLSNVDLNYALLGGADLNNAPLPYADLSNADLNYAHLDGANLRGASLSNANLLGAHLSGADLNYAHLDGAYLTGADLRNADLGGALLGGANLGGAHLSNADLSNADLSNADLTDALGLTQEQLKSAIGNKGTQLPHSLVMPKSWK